MKTKEALYSNSYAKKKAKEESDRIYQNYEKQNRAFHAEALSKLSLVSFVLASESVCERLTYDKSNK